MMKRALIPLVLCAAGLASSQPKLAAQDPPPTTVTTLPGVKVAEAVPAVGTSRVYYTTHNDELFLYDRASQTSTLVSRGAMSEIALSRRNDRIAFGRGSETDATNLHIWTLPLDPATGGAAGPARRVSVRPGRAPSFSPDGQRIAFIAKDSAGTEQVAVVPASGGAERIVDRTPRSIELIRWSPDGQSLYVGDWGPTGDLTAAYRVSVADGSATLIAKTGSSYPGPSPDGRLIVTVDEAWDSLVVMDPDGNRLGTLPWMNAADIGSWSGDARLFVPDGGPPWKLWAYSLTDGSTRALTDSTSDVGTPRWSPDGRRIAVMDRNAGGLSLMNADGSGVRTLAKELFPVMDCSWSPDGRWILFTRWVTGATWSLKAVEVATGREATLASHVRFPGGPLSGSAARWAPDSKSLFYTQVIDTIAGFPLGARSALHEATLAGTDRVVREVTVYRGAYIGVPIFGDSVMEIGTLDGGHAVTPLRTGTPEITLIPGSQPGAVSFPSFSRDGRRVAYRINPNAKSATDNSVWSAIEVMNLDGSQRTRIDVPFNAATGLHNPMFLPDPRELLVAGQDTRDGPISFYRVSLDGRISGRLLTIPWPRYGRNHMVFDLSPDGNTLLYVTDEPPFSTFSDVDLSSFLRLVPGRKSP